MLKMCYKSCDEDGVIHGQPALVTKKLGRPPKTGTGVAVAKKRARTSKTGAGKPSKGKAGNGKEEASGG